MNRNLFARGLAVLIMGLLLAAYINHENKKWRRLGRDAFVAHELERFDRFIAPPDSFGIAVFGAIILTPVTFGVYELMAFILAAFLRTATSVQMGPPSVRSGPNG